MNIMLTVLVHARTRAERRQSHDERRCCEQQHDTRQDIAITATSQYRLIYNVISGT